MSKRKAESMIIRWTNGAGHRLAKKVSYASDYTEAEVVGHILRMHDPSDGEETDIVIEKL